MTTEAPASGIDPERPLRTLVVTNIWPTALTPALGTFVADQVASLRDAGVEVELLRVDRKVAGRGVYGRLAEKARRVVASTRPDLVHVMYGGVTADIVTRTVRDRPVVVSFCGTDLLGGKGSGLIHGLSRRYGVLASRRAAMRAAGIVVKSRNLFEALPARTTARVWIVPNGVDLERFRPLERGRCQSTLGWDPGRRHVLFPSPRDRPEKRFELAEAAAALLNGRGAAVELHALAGVPHEDVPTWLNASDVVLLTSVHEGSPNVVKEALACNVPVVSVDVGDVHERIEGIDGCFIADATPNDVAAKVAKVLERDEPIAARERVAELSLERVGARLRRIYATLATGV